MFYGVEQSTDLRDRRTNIVKFKSETALKKWLSLGQCKLTYSDPDAARNHHHTLKYGYELARRVDRKDPIFKYSGTSTYPCTQEDNLVNYLYKYGTEIEA